MSFSGRVKLELLAYQDKKAHCQRAELAAILSGSGRIYAEAGKLKLEMATDQEGLAEKFQALIRSVSGLAADLRHKEGRNSWQVSVSGEAEMEKLLHVLKIMENDGTIRDNMNLPNGLLLQRSCCKRAFLRGAFLAGGSMSDPRKSYHFEIVCQDQAKALQIREAMDSFELDAKIVSRKDHQIVYLKEGSKIVDALNVMGAHKALMDLENVRILKEMRNDVNRRVNCETANINKTVTAAYRQQEAIRFLQNKGLLGDLPDQLQEIARLRMEYPEATIRELGIYCLPAVGKSGVNHRLRKLEEIADRLGYEKRDQE